MVVVGIDLGYGDTKVVGTNGQREKFPSRWAKHDVEAWGIGGGMTVLKIDEGDNFVFGEFASGPNAREPLGDGRLSDPDSLPLLASALWQCGVGEDGNPVDITIGSGTPLGTFDKEVAAAREFLQGKTFTITSVKGEIRKFVINRLIMRPQGVGAALYMLDKGIITQQPGYGMIVDVGSRTTDVLTVNLMNMEPVVPMSFSIQAGIGDAVSDIGKAIAKETCFVVATDIARAALSGEIMFKERKVGGPEVSQPILKALADRIMDNLRANLRSELDRVTALVPVGGGANLIGDMFESLAPGALMRIPEEDLQFANALGYKDAAERSAD